MKSSIISLKDIVKVHGTVFGDQYIGTLHPVSIGVHGMVSAGTKEAALVGYDILKKGGNAFDAGVAAAAAVNVTKMEMAGWCGVTPFIGYVVSENKVMYRPGVGTAPALATAEWYKTQGHLVMPIGMDAYLSAIIPTNVDTFVAILQDYGTISLAEALEGAIRLAEEGWPVSNGFAAAIAGDEKNMREWWPYNVEVWLQYGRPPRVGELIFQKDLAKTFRTLVEAEQKALCNGLSRYAALEAARDVFYKGEIAQAIGRFNEKIGGLIRYDDLANFKGEWATPVHTNYKGIDVYVTDTVSQGPLLVEYLNMLENFDVKALGHNTTEYIHLLSQIINLGMSDRYYHFGDPKFVEVPDGLYTKEYAKELIKQIDLNKAFSEMPPKSNPGPFSTSSSSSDSPKNVVIDLPETTKKAADNDTTYLCVMDKDGNIFSMTPSDGHFTTPLIPGYGFGLASRGYRFMRVDGHQQDVEPGKRPMNTPNPALALKHGKSYMAFGTAGGDNQTQSMLQVFLNIVEFGMNVQQAVEQNRFGSLNFIETESPYPYKKGKIEIHDGIDKEVIEALKAKGHKVSVLPWQEPMSNPMCILRDDDGIMWGGADFRRDENYTAGW